MKRDHEGTEYFELRMSPLLKRRLVEETEGKKVLNDLMIAYLCQGLGLDPALGMPPRGRIGRPPKMPRLRKPTTPNPKSRTTRS
jgi:hypothetical protein